MTLAPHEFIRRFLLHVLPKGFHRIRHYGLLANGGRAENIAHARSCSRFAGELRPRALEPRSPSPASCRGHARTAAGA